MRRSFIVIKSMVALGLLLLFVSGGCSEMCPDMRRWGGYGGYQGPDASYCGSRPSVMGWGPVPLYQQPSKPLTENYVYSRCNSNLKVGEITEEDICFEAEILTKNDVQVDKALVDKNTGWMRSIYCP